MKLAFLSAASLAKYNPTNPFGNNQFVNLKVQVKQEHGTLNNKTKNSL